MYPRFREHTGARQNARHRTERWVHSIQTGTRQNPGLRRFSSPLRNSGDFYLSPCHPEGCCKNYFCSSPIFTPCKRSWGMRISFFRSPNAPQLDGAFHPQGNFSFVCKISKEFFLFPRMSSNKSPLGPHFAADHFSLRPPIKSWLQAMY